MFFRRKKEETSVTTLNNSLDISFKNVSKDIYNIFSWLNYLNDRILSVQKQLDFVPKSKEEVKQIIDSYYSYENMLHKISELNERVDNVSRKQNQVPEELDEIRTKLRKIAQIDDKQVPQIRTETKTETSKLDEINDRLKNIEEQRKRNLREVMVKKLTRNSKEYVKNVITSLIRKYGKIPALKLKEMIVDEQGLCSKSSFYRLLNEVQEESEVSVAHKGKEKEIVFKLQKN